MVDFSWWDWHGHPSILIGVLLLEGGYVFGAGTLRRRLGGATPVGLGQAALFTLGVLVIVIALYSPLHELSDKYLFSAHMVQHMLLLWVMPPLLLWGLPAWLLRPAVASPLRFRVAKLVTNPLMAIAIFNGVILFWHLPAAYNGSLEHHNLHIFQHVTFMMAGVLMWWPVLSSLPELPRLSSGGQMLYLFVQSLLPAIVGGVITFAGTVLYDFYAAAPRVWDISPMADQQIGGLIMKTAGTIVFVIALAAVFFAWAAREEEKDAHRGPEGVHGS